MRYVCLLLLLIVFRLEGQDGNYLMGARQGGLGGASVMLQDQWSLFNNISGIESLEHNAILSSYNNRFGLKELQTVAAGYIRHLEDFSMGASFYRFGGELFNEQRFQLGVAHRLDRVSLGLSVGYLQYNISTVDSRGVFVIDFGGIADITDQISFGAHIFNLNQASLAGRVNVPTIMRAGLSFDVTEDFLVVLETEKDLDFPEVYKAGLEYRIIDNVWIRTGLRTEPFKGAFGVGFKPRNYLVDYAFSNDVNLGAIHEVSGSFFIGSQ